jgi:hypothetical protein
MQNNELEINISKLVKTYEINTITASFNILPWIIVFVSIIIIVTYLIKIDINSNGKNWEINKCSSKYLFFPGITNGKEKDILKQRMHDFRECVRRYS